MIIKQLSVFLKQGRAADGVDRDSGQSRNQRSLKYCGHFEFGIIRTVVSDPEKALQILKEHNFSVSLTDVVCLTTPNKPGALARALGSLL